MRKDEAGGRRQGVLDEAGRVSGRQLFALVWWPAEVAPPQTQTLRETPVDKTGRGLGGPGEPRGGGTAETGREVGERQERRF